VYRHRSRKKGSLLRNLHALTAQSLQEQSTSSCHEEENQLGPRRHHSLGSLASIRPLPAVELHQNVLQGAIMLTSVTKAGSHATFNIGRYRGKKPMSGKKKKKNHHEALMLEG
jgi:hypothetical protein